MTGSGEAEANIKTAAGFVTGPPAALVTQGSNGYVDAWYGPAGKTYFCRLTWFPPVGRFSCILDYCNQKMKAF